MLRTTADVLEALRARKDQLGLSDALVDEIAGLTQGHAGKVLSGSGVRTPRLETLMCLIGALGLYVELKPDPDTALRRRWTKRRDKLVTDNNRISKAAIKKARPLVLAAAARHAAKARWARMSIEQRQAHIAMMNLARKNKAA